MITGKPYEEVLIHAARIAPCEDGLWLHQIVEAAAHLGVALEWKRPRRFNLLTDSGILHVYNTRKKLYHVVVLWEGRIIDPETACWLDPAAFLKAEKWRAGALLSVAASPSSPTV